MPCLAPFMTIETCVYFHIFSYIECDILVEKKSLKLPDYYKIYTSIYKALYLTIVIVKEYYKDEHFIFIDIRFLNILHR